MSTSPSSIGRNPPWVRDELILALDLYFRVNPTRLSQSSPEILELSQTLNALPLGADRPDASRFRNHNGVYMKLCNFLTFDPDYPGSGLTHGSRMDREIWEEFAGDRDRLHRLAHAIRSFPHFEQPDTSKPTFPEDEDVSAPEGRVLNRVHAVRERNRSLVNRKKVETLRRLGKLQCEVCGFCYSTAYGHLGDGFIECHHTVPLSQLRPGQTTRLSDLALVCANCHRMLHRGGDEATMAQLRRVVQSQRNL